jgi:FkbM family methyltransferase
MFSLVGNQYGGKILDLDLVEEGSVVISAGIGEDVSFDRELIERKNCRIVGIDPTEKSIQYVNSLNLRNFELITKALSMESNQVVRMFKNNNPEHVSESVLNSHNAVNSSYHEVQTIGLLDILNEYENISVLKMDIEGSEYDILMSLDELNVPQVCVEFHHFCSHYSLQDTKNVIEKLSSIGYSHYVPKDYGNPYLELTFVNNGVL